MLAHSSSHTLARTYTHSQVSTPNNVGVPSVNPLRAESPDVTLSKPHQAGNTPMTPDVRLWHRAVVVHQVCVLCVCMCVCVCVCTRVSVRVCFSLNWRHRQSG